MPNRPKRKQRPWQRERIPFARRTNDNYDFYNSTKWRKKSKLYRDAHPFCECDDCVENNLVKPAEVVDHTRGLQFLLDNGLDPFDDNELNSMSHLCHNKKSGKDAHKNKK